MVEPAQPPETPPTAIPEELLTDVEVCRILRCGTHALRRMRQRGDGPPFIRVAGRPLYPPTALGEWIDARTSATA